MKRTTIIRLALVPLLLAVSCGDDDDDTASGYHGPIPRFSVDPLEGSATATALAPASRSLSSNIGRWLRDAVGSRAFAQEAGPTNCNAQVNAWNAATLDFVRNRSAQNKNLLRLNGIYAQAVFYDCWSRLQARQFGVGVSTQIDDETGEEEEVTVLTSDYSDTRPEENARYFTAWTDLPESEYVKGRMINVPVRENQEPVAWTIFHTTADGGGAETQSVRFIAQTAGDAGNRITVMIEDGGTTGKKYTIENGAATYVCDDIEIANLKDGLNDADCVPTVPTGISGVVRVQVYDHNNDGTPNGEPHNSGQAIHLSGGDGSTKTRVDLLVEDGLRTVKSILQREASASGNMAHNFYTRADFEEKDSLDEDGNPVPDGEEGDGEIDEHWVSGRYWDDFSGTDGRTLFILQASVRKGKGTSIFVKECPVATLAAAKTTTTCGGTVSAEYYNISGGTIAPGDAPTVGLRTNASELTEASLFYLGQDEVEFFTVPTDNWIQDSIYD